MLPFVSPHVPQPFTPETTTAGDDWFAQNSPSFTPSNSTIDPGTGYTPMPSTGTTTYPGAPGGTSFTPGAPSGQADPMTIFNQMFPGDMLSPEMLKAHEAELAAHGILLAPNAAGVVGKIKLPTGQIIDVIQGAGSGVNKKQWLTGDGGAGGAGAYGGDFGSAVTPWTKAFQPSAPFTMPTLQDLQNSPGYQARLDAGLKGVQTSAAAKGTLLTGGTLKGLNQFGQDFASNEYGNLFNQAQQVNTTAYNRGLGEYGLERENFQMNQDRPFNKYKTLADLGKP